MQKKKCPILQIIGLIAVVAAVIVVLPKAIAFVKEKFAKDDIDDLDFEFEEEDSEFVRPEPMEAESVSAEPVQEKAAAKEEEIFEEE